MNSYGQTLAKKYLRLLLGDEPFENYRPPWLEGLEIDLFFPALGLGVEFQGDQHYVPVFGAASCHAQKYRDGVKKDLCKERNIPLMRIDASDLEYTRLRFKIKQAVGGVKGLRKFMARKEIRMKLRSLNKEAIAYRKTLTENFGAITARRKGYTRRLARYQWMSRNGFYCVVPDTPAERRAKKQAKREATKAHKAMLAASGLSMLPP